MGLIAMEQNKNTASELTDAVELVYGLVNEPFELPSAQPTR